MHTPRLPLVFLGAISLALTVIAADPPKIEDLQAQAAKFNAILTIPTFETTTEAVTKAADAPKARKVRYVRRILSPSSGSRCRGVFVWRGGAGLCSSFCAAAGPR